MTSSFIGRDLVKTRKKFLMESLAKHQNRLSREVVESLFLRNLQHVQMWCLWTWLDFNNLSNLSNSVILFCDNPSICYRQCSALTKKEVLMCSGGPDAYFCESAHKFPIKIFFLHQEEEHQSISHCLERRMKNQVLTKPWVFHLLKEY